jgi:hypothetical protein
MTAATMTYRQVTARRTTRHHLHGPAGATIAQVAADVAGIHAQIMSAAEVGVGIRVPASPASTCGTGCGATESWSRPGALAAPSTCSPPPTCR